SSFFFFSSRRRHTRSVSAFLLNRSSDLKDQVYAQNEMLAYQQKESTARVASIMENTNLSKQQQVSEIMRQMLTQAQTAVSRNAEIGRASCRERVWIWVVGGSVRKRASR